MTKYACLKVLQLVPKLQKTACLGRRFCYLNYLLDHLIQQPLFFASSTNKKTPYAVTHTVYQNFSSLFQCFCSCLFISRTSVAKFKGLAKWLFIPAFFASMISSAKARSEERRVGKEWRCREPWGQ